MLNGLMAVIIMRTLNNTKGSLLVILIIAITLIAVLGASFVSVVSSKHETFTFLVNGHKANMIAKAGVEWAIRYISDGLSDTGSTYYLNLPAQPATNKVFADGSFNVNWDYIANDYITVNGTYHGITEIITLSNFRRYLQPITLIPDTSYRPTYRTNRRLLDVFVMGNNDTTIPRIDLTTNTSGMILRYIYVQDTETGVTTTIFDYTDTNFTDCTYPAQTNCIRTVFWGFIDLGLSMKPADQTFDSALAKLKASSTKYNKTYKYIFEFLNNAPSPAPQHTTIFYSAPVVSKVKFRP
ncbi:MAG: hypothetical protein H6Q52_969 [Deltaproteobacteria bacterium]|nr:hypothetical protein [Deltaproteobacteria bacterium]